MDKQELKLLREQIIRERKNVLMAAKKLSCYGRFRIECVKQGLKFNKALEQAIKLWMGEKI